ncbi:FCD domain-containing protein [Terrarubrum flagellatum]|uniref:FCD domain-containing protein n=1 Tax=Terrirubrum flagellatum TaxID=2895980 RepID=UPI00314529DB
MTESPTLSAIELIRSNSLPMLLEQEIERAVLGGELAPGQRVNEKELATRFGVSRGPVREALRGLEAAGLVEQVPNRGVFVRKLSWAEASNVYDVRAALFGYAGQLLSQRVDAAGVAQLRGFVADMDVAVEAGDFERYVRLNFAFHEYIVRESGNAVLAEQYLGLIKQLRLYRTRNLMLADSVHASNREHHAMVDAIEARDGDRAYRAHFDHVALAKRRLATAGPQAFA